jgi:hypothetical protein
MSQCLDPHRSNWNVPTIRDRFSAARTAWKTGRASVSRPAPSMKRRSISRLPTRIVLPGLRPTRPERSAPPRRDRVQALAQIITAITAIGALVFTSRSLDYTADATKATYDQLHITEQGQITDRFAKAAEQLGSDKVDVRLGAIYALERIMRDCAADQPAVLEILAAYIRQRVPPAAPEPSFDMVSPTPPPTKPPLIALPIDVTATITVLGRRNATHEQPISQDQCRRGRSQ